MKKFNLMYRTKKGKIVAGRTLKGTRRIEFASGVNKCKAWISKNLEYLGRFTEDGDFVEYKKPKLETIISPNGFKIVRKVA